MFRLLALVLLLALAGCGKPAAPLPKMYQLPAFSVTERSGQPFTLESMRGKVWVADFFFADCTTLCVEMNRHLSSVRHKTAALPNARYLSISIRETDTPEKLRAYAARDDIRADARWLFVTGKRADVYKLSVDGFKLGLQQNAMLDTAAGEVIHDSHLVLIDQDGWIRGYYDGTGPDYDAEEKRLVADIGRLHGFSLADLPAVNASLNALATLLIIVALIAIKREQKRAHGWLMGAAFITSSIFLILYVTHKIYVGGAHTPFRGEGAWKPIYYTMLLTHILLAIAVPPLAIVTMRRAVAGNFEAHRRIARITYPIWLYVGVTGVLVYFFLYRWFLPA